MTYKTCLLTVLLPLALLSCSNGDESDIDANALSGGVTVTDGGTASSALSVEFDESDLEETDAVYTDEAADADLYEDYVENAGEFKNIVNIVWDGSSVTCTQSNDDGDIVITNSGADVTVKAAKKAQYILSGTCSDGSFKVYSEKKFQVTLNGLTLTNPTGAAINSQTKKRMYLVVADGTQNTLQDGSSYTAAVPAYDEDGNATGEYEDEKGVIFSEGQIVVSGGGKLNINAVGKNGLVSDQYLRIRPTTHLTVAAASTASNALKADSVLIMGGVVNLGTASADGKGIQSETDVIISGGRTTVITTGSGDASSGGGGGMPGGIRPGMWGTRATASSSGNAPKGVKAGARIRVTGGTLRVRCDGSSGEGIESKYSGSDAAILVSGGDVLSYAKQDDAVNATGMIQVTGGTLKAYATGNDAIDSNYGRAGAVTVGGGTLMGISSAGSPEEGIDCDNVSNITVTGGTLVCLGGSQSGGGSLSSATTQGYYISTGQQSFVAGQTYTLYSGSTAYLRFTTPLSVSSALTILSAPGMTLGTGYSLQ